MELFCPVHRITLILRTAQTLHAHVVDPSTHLRHSRNTLRAVSPLSSAAAQRDSFTVVYRGSQFFSSYSLVKKESTMKCWFFSFFVITLVVHRYMASPVPNGNGEDKEAYEDVKELESLRNENSRANSTEQNHQADSTAGKTPPESPTNDEVEPQTNSRSAIFRHRGITQAKKSKYWNEKVEQPNEGSYTKYAGIQYSPTDLAEYVFSTGDEEGVAVAVEELVREGMMGRTDAINYLQDVKQMLQYMREQYEQKKILEEMRNRAYPKPQISQRLPSPPREQFVSQMAAEKREQQKEPELPPAPVATTEHPHQEVIASTSEPKGLTKSASTTVRPKTDTSVVENAKEDFKRMMNDRNSDNYDFALEVIYKLAKDMFSESIAKDDPVAEDTLSRLVAFMENEVENKRISPEMKQKVLAIVSNALVDSLRQYQRMMPENQPQNFEEGNFYHHLSSQAGASPSKLEMPEAYRKLTVGG